MSKMSFEGADISTGHDKPLVEQFVPQVCGITHSDRYSQVVVTSQDCLDAKALGVGVHIHYVFRHGKGS